MAKCFKCHKEYESTDLSDLAGDGYCPPCKEEKTLIAQSIDAKLGKIPSKSKPPVDYDISKSIQNGIEITIYRDKMTSRILGK